MPMKFRTSQKTRGSNNDWNNLYATDNMIQKFSMIQTIEDYF